MSDPLLPKLSSLTRQQRAMLSEFWASNWPECPYEHTDGSLMEGTGYRAWPTMDNLVAKGLVARVGWEDDYSGWLYRVTPAGHAVLAAAFSTFQAGGGDE